MVLCVGSWSMKELFTGIVIELLNDIVVLNAVYLNLNSEF